MLSTTKKNIKGEFKGPQYCSVWLTLPFQHYYYFISNEDIWRLNCKTFEWENLQPSGDKPEARCGAIHQNSLYAPTAKKTYKLDFSTHTWTTITTIGRGPETWLKGSLAVTVNDTIAVCTGDPEFGISPLLHFLNLKTKKWSHIEIEDVYYMSSWGDCVFVLGKRNDGLRWYNTKTKRKTKRMLFNEEIDFCYAYQWTYKNYWYFCHGGERTERKTKIFRFDMQIKKWDDVLYANDYVPREWNLWSDAVGDTTIILQQSSFNACTCISLISNKQEQTLMRLLKKGKFVDVEFQVDNSPLQLDNCEKKETTEKKRQLRRNTRVRKKRKIFS